MSHTDAYKQIVDSTPDDLPEKIMDVLTKAYQTQPGANVTKQEIIRAVFGEPDFERNRVNSTKDRQVRDVIADLQLEGYPIIASSGKAGYRLAANVSEATQYIAELESRVSQLQGKIRALRTPNMKHVYKPPTKATQIALI